MNGLIAFFDILGYKSFLENNSATETAEKVLKIINDTPETVKAGVSLTWQNKAKDDPEKYIQEISERFNYLVFSDTVVLSIEFPDQASENWKSSALFFMQIVVIVTN